MPKKEAPVILFDLDRTMLNTGALSEAILGYLFQEYGQFNITLEQVKGWSKSYVTEILGNQRTHYSPAGFMAYFHSRLEKIPSQNSIPSAEQMTVDLSTFIQRSVAQFLYAETLEVLRQLSELGCVLCLYTQGVETWQKLKFIHAALAEFFETHFQFVSSDKAGLEHLQFIQSVLYAHGLENREVWLVDDSKEIISNAQSAWPGLGAFLVDRDKRTDADVLTEDQHLVGSEDVTIITSLLPLVEFAQALVAADSSPVAE